MSERRNIQGETGFLLTVGRLVAPLVVLSLPVFATDLSGPARVIDGDTLAINGDKIRLHGIDAPERRQVCEAGGVEYRCGVTAAAWVIKRTVGNEVRCESEKRDRYKRLIAVCYVGDANLNEGIVRAGWALAYRRYSLDYVPAEGDARLNVRGLWAGTFDAPWEWRRANTQRRK